MLKEKRGHVEREKTMVKEIKIALKGNLKYYVILGHSLESGSEIEA